MLFGAGHRQYDMPAGLDTVHNYYEHLVLDHIFQTDELATADVDLIADVVCIALNHLPPQYVRHDVDMTFCLSPAELEDIYNNVKVAVADAVGFVQNLEQDEEGPSSEDT